MPTFLKKLLGGATDEAEKSLISDNEREDPVEQSKNFTMLLGRIGNLGDNKQLLIDWLKTNPHQKLDNLNDEEIYALGQAMRDKLITAGIFTTTGQVIAKILDIPVVSQITSLFNAGHTKEQANKLYKIAKNFEAQNSTDTNLNETINNCAHFKDGKTGGQITAIAVGVGATVGGGIVAATAGLALIPAAIITGAAAMTGTVTGYTSNKSITKMWSWNFDKAQAAEILIDNAILEEDGSAKKAAQDALKVLGLNLTELEGIKPTPINEADSEKRKLLNRLVMLKF